MSETTVVKCDRCSVVIEPLSTRVQLQINKSKLDLCKGCDASLASWLKEPAEQRRREERLRERD